jgi:DNA invertase Pin-like site-specific DNA recombinase
MTKRYVSYVRVSTVRQGQSGLGLDAQRASVAQFLRGAEPLAEFIEVESGKHADALAKRPQLRAALDMCKKTGASLLIARLDRLSRSVLFIATLLESKIAFTACDLPEASELTIHIMSAFAQHEARRISERTKAALAQAKARGTVLGRAGPRNLRPNIEERRQAADQYALGLQHVIRDMERRKLKEREMRDEFNRLGFKSPAGKPYLISTVRSLRARLRGLALPEAA